MNGTTWMMALLAGASLVQAQAQSTWALRFDAQGTWSGQQKMELVAAERGEYAVSPALVDRDGDFVVVARDAAGQVLYMHQVADPRRLQAEEFDPATGKIVQAKEIILSSGQFELRIPALDNVATVSIEMRQPGGMQAADATPTTAALFKREDIEGRITDTSQRMRVAKAASGTEMLHQSGPSSQRFDIVLIGDGYTAAEQAKWKADAQRVAQGLLADPLFNAQRGALNIRRVDVISNQSGIDDLTYRTYRDTALGMNIGCYGTDRLVCADDNLVYSAVGSVTPADGRDVIIAVGNTTRYGGAGGAIATMTMHSSAIELALHEIGHTAFKLADEYDYGSCAGGEPSEKNVTRQTSRSAIKWADLIQSSTPLITPAGKYANGTVGLFNGARYCTSGVYRPTENSRMRSLGQPWHAVNERHANAVIASYYKPDGGTTEQRPSLSGTGATANHPSPYHYSASGGTITASLTGPANADFELLLLRWNGSTWATVASSTSPTSTESIRYNASAGYYVVQVKSYSGSGEYDLKYTLPR